MGVALFVGVVIWVLATFVFAIIWVPLSFWLFGDVWTGFFIFSFLFWVAFFRLS